MLGTVTVSFAPGRAYELKIAQHGERALTAEDASLWLSQQWEEFECTPRSMVGKILAVDKILQIAQEAGEKRFAEAGAWAQRYAEAVVAVLDRDRVRIDVAENTVG